VRRYSNLDLDPLAIGREQRVGYVLTAHYQLAEDSIRVTGQLVDVQRATVDMTFSFEKAATSGTFAIQNAVAAELEARLAPRLGTAVSDVTAHRGTNNEDAYRSYLLAVNFAQQRLTQDMEKAAEFFEQAVEEDPDFAKAWAAKAMNHAYLRAYRGANVHEQYRKSMEAVQRALALNPNLAEAHAALCLNKNRHEYDAAGAEAACRRALELDPDSSEVQKVYSNFLYTQGRFDEAIQAARKAIDLQPLSYDHQQTLGLALYFARRHSEEEAQWKRLIELNPNHKPIYNWLVRCLARQGKHAEALEYLVKSLTMENANDGTIRRLRAAFVTSGWRGVTEERIRLAAARENTSSFELARFYASINDKDNAFKVLDRAYQERSNMIAVLGVDPELDPLRNDPRYIELLHKVNIDR
jgi:tetratricopeptide (TPR) repeat protein